MDQAERIELAVKGARSVHVVGWKAEECESAAIERVLRYPDSPLGAFRMGRLAALEEFRNLTGGRTGSKSKARKIKTTALPTRGRTWDYPEDIVPATDDPEREASDAVDIARWAIRQSAQRQTIITMLADGATKRECAEALGVDPTRVSQLLAAIREEGRF